MFRVSSLRRASTSSSTPTRILIRRRPPSSRSIVEAAERGLSRYPDPLCTAFRMRAADVLGVPPDWILCGNGSDDILTIVTRALVGQGDRAATALSQLRAVPHAGRNPGCAVRAGAFCQQLGTDSATLPQVSPRLKLVFLPNPNSPSGTMVSPEQILDLAERLPCPLLVDEAYADFADTNCLELVAQNPQDHGVAQPEQIVRVGGTAIRLPGGPARD